jgi:trk system potassium uptake protein TrkA
MNVVVVGCGTNGKYAAIELARVGHSVAVIDIDFQAEEMWSIASMEDLNINVVIGDGCEVPTLTKANAAEADVVLACTGDDEDNLVISLLAKQEFGVPRVIARVNHPRNEWLFNDHWGIDRAVSPSHMLTSLVEEEVSQDKIVELLSFDDGRVELVETKLSGQSGLAGKSIEELDIPRECSVVAVVREGHVIFPRPETVIASGDEVILLTSKSTAAEVHEIFG